MSEQSTPAPTSEQVEYRDVPGFPGYRVGSDGSVWSCRRFSRNPAGVWRQLRPSVRRDGYLLVGLAGSAGQVSHLVHRLVLLAFVGPCPDGMEACHYDGDEANNRTDNLRWDTAAGNRADNERLGRTQRGERAGGVKLTSEQVRVIRDLYAAGGMTQSRIAAAFHVSQPAVNAIVQRNTWKHV